MSPGRKEKPQARMPAPLSCGTFVPAIMKTTCLGMFLCVVALNAQAPDGEAIYKKQCALCHDNGAASRAPDRAALSQRTADSAMTSLTAGTMAAQGATLSDAEKRAVV